MEKIFTELQAINSRLETQDNRINERFKVIEQRFSLVEDKLKRDEENRKEINKRMISLERKKDFKNNKGMKVMGSSKVDIQEEPEPCSSHNVAKGDFHNERGSTTGKVYFKRF